MYKLKFNLIILSIFLVYTQGLWERLLLAGDIIKYLIDAFLLLAVLINFKYSFKVPGSKIFLWFLITIFVVSIGNSTNFIDTFLYIRYILFAYLIFHQFYITRLTVRQFKILLKIIYFSVLIQGIGAAFNLFVLGIRVEGYVGLMSSLGGTTATTFPLLVIVLVVLFFFLNTALNRKLLVSIVMLLASAFLVSFSSGKRGIYLLAPLMILIVIGLIGKNIKLKKLRQLVIGVISIVPIFFYGISNSRGFNYNLSGNESYGKIAKVSRDYTESYETATDQYGNSIGRSNSTLNIVDNSLKNNENFFFGHGFGMSKNESFLKTINVNYGIVGFTNTLVSGGWVFTVLFVVLMLRIILKTNYKIDRKSRLILKTIAITFLITHLMYSSDYFVSLKLMFIVMLILAIVKSPFYLDYKYQLFKLLKLIS